MYAIASLQFFGGQRIAETVGCVYVMNAQYCGLLKCKCCIISSEQQRTIFVF
jgi:hypothetical protein